MWWVMFLSPLLQVHQGVIQDCSTKASISLFIQITICLSNITCCLDALCYYFIAHEVRSTKNTFKLSMINQRRATFSTSEVWTRDPDNSSSNMICPQRTAGGFLSFRAEQWNLKKRKGPVLFSVAMWHALMVENELGQSAISINHSAESKTKMYRESI